MAKIPISHNGSCRGFFQCLDAVAGCLTFRGLMKIFAFFNFHEVLIQKHTCNYECKSQFSSKSKEGKGVYERLKMNMVAARYVEGRCGPSRVD